MEFKGENTLTLTLETVRKLVEDGINGGQQRTRVLSVDFGVYGHEIRVTFTTDPPEEPPTPDPSSSYGSTESE